MLADIRLGLALGLLAIAIPCPAQSPLPAEAQLFGRRLEEADGEKLAPADALNVAGLMASYGMSQRPADVLRLGRIYERLLQRGMTLEQESSENPDVRQRYERLIGSNRLGMLQASAALGQSQAGYDGLVDKAAMAAVEVNSFEERVIAFDQVASSAFMMGDFVVARDLAKAALDEISSHNRGSALGTFAPDGTTERASESACVALSTHAASELSSASQEQEPDEAAQARLDQLTSELTRCVQISVAAFRREQLRNVHKSLAVSLADATLATDAGEQAAEALTQAIAIERAYDSNSARQQLQLGQLLISMGRTDAAQPSLLEARRLAKRDIGLGELAAYSGLQTPGESLFGAPSQSGLIARSLLLAGETELALGRTEVALGFFTTAEAGIGATIGRAGLLGARAIYLVGLAQLRLGRTDDAIARLAKASEMYDAYAPTTRDLRRVASGRFEGALDVHLTLLEAAERRGDLDLMGQAAARAARAGISRSSGAALLRLESGAALTSVREAQDAARAASDAEDALEAALASGADQSVIRSTASRLAPARQRAQQTLQALLAAQPEFQLFGLGPAPSLAAMQRRLRPGEALLLFGIGRDQGFALALSSQRYVLHRIPVPRAKLRQLVARVAESSRFVRRGDRYTLPRFAMADSSALYDALIRPLDPALTGVSRLYIARNGVLDALSFHTLYDREQSRWLSDRFASSIVPDPSRVGVNVPARSRARNGVLGIGDPLVQNAGWLRDLTIDGARPARITSASQQSAGSPGLAGARTELEAIARAWPDRPSRIMVGAQASEQAFRREVPSEYGILAFATHAVTASPRFRSPKPALVFTPGGRTASSDNDGLLHPEEIEDLKLRAEIVILSACETAAGNGLPNAEALSGLAQAFLYAGSQSVIATHWKVDSRSAADLMAGTMRAETGRPRDLAVALQKAIRKMKSEPNRRHPAYWAPFVIVETGERFESALSSN